MVLVALDFVVFFCWGDLVEDRFVVVFNAASFFEESTGASYYFISLWGVKIKTGVSPGVNETIFYDGRLAQLRHH